MDKRIKGDGKERKMLVTLPAALHRRVKALAVETDRTLDDVVVEMLGKALADRSGLSDRVRHAAAV